MTIPLSSMPKAFLVHGCEVLNEGELAGSRLPTEGGVIIYGNSCRDDSRERPFDLRSRVGAVFWVQVPAAVSSFRERRTTVVYKDFGHLKGLPATDVLLISDSVRIRNEMLSV